jgi:cation transport ATPase
MSLRLPIVIGIYAFIVVFLPGVPQFARLFDRIRQIHPNTAITVSVIALVLAAIGLWVFWRKPNGLLYTRPTPALIVLNMGLIGVAFAGVFDVFERLSGRATSLESMVLVPTAFMVAEAAYLAIAWRMARGPLGGRDDEPPR